MFSLKSLKLSLAATSCLAALSATAHAASFNIPSGDLAAALNSYTAQSGISVIVSGDTVRGAKTRGVQGNLGAEEALTRILSGTGFSVQRDASGAVAIVPGRASDATQIQNLQLAQSAPAGRIEEVLVTARRREEAVENIPISITAFTAEDLKTFGVRNFADLEGIVPGLNLGGGGNGVKRDSSPFIRGVGQRETKVTLDPAVATYIDGVYIGRAAGAMLDVTDVSSIQVLRGPQGTLFGRNATGGAISVILNKPTNEWEGNVSVNIGNYGRRDISGVINVPFVEDFLMGRLFISSTNSNGYFTNIVDNAKWGGDNRITGIAQLRFQPTDRITVDVLGERTRIRETPRPQRCAFIRDAGWASYIVAFMNGYDSSFQPLRTYEDACRASQALPPSRFDSDLSDLPGSIMPKGRYWVDTTTASVTANWDVGDLGFISDFNVKNTAAWRKTKQIADEDLDAISKIYLIRIQPDFDETIQISEELQFSGKTLNDRLFFSTGFYYFKEKTPRSDLILSAGINPPRFSPAGTHVFGPIDVYEFQFAEPAKERLRTNNDSYAWYGQVDFDVTREIQISGGIRWTREVHWSGYSKSYADPYSMTVGDLVPRVFNNVYVQSFGGGAIMGLTSTQPGIVPVLDWGFASREYFFTGPNPPAPVDWRYVDKFIGDSLRMSNEAWTPMFSVKYNASESVLQQLGLDQAMVYATYSQGFHSGGVTAGAIDLDLSNQDGTVPGNMGPTNRPATSTVPCPSQINANATSCPTFYRLPDEGYGTADPIIFRPEKVTNYEIGFKMAGLVRRLQANLSAFWMNYTDMQTTAVGTRAGVPVPYVENVGKSVIRGIEAEVVVMPTPQWRLFINGAYTDADIVEWDAKVDVLSLLGNATPATYIIDRSDERMVRVPRWQFFGSSEYNFNMGSMGSITPQIGVRFTSSIYHGFDRGSWTYTYGGYFYNDGGTGRTQAGVPVPDGDPLVKPSPNAKWQSTSRPTAFLDARVTWNSEDGRMEAALWGKNLFNKDDYLVGGIPLADVTGAIGQVYANPRTFGLTFTYHFAQ